MGKHCVPVSGFPDLVTGVGEWCTQMKQGSRSLYNGKSPPSKDVIIEIEYSIQLGYIQTGRANVKSTASLLYKT